MEKTIRVAKKFKKFPIRRQDAPKTYDMNASIYIWKRNILLKSDNLFRKKHQFILWILSDQLM